MAAFLTVGAAAFAFKLVSASRELVVAYHFGTGDALDAFILAFLAPSFAITVQIAAFSAALMPVFIRVRSAEGEAAARRLAENTLVAAAVLLVASSVLLLLVAPALVKLLGSGFAPGKQALTLHLLYLMVPVIVIQGLIKFYGTLINARHRFGLVAALPLATPILTMLLLVLAQRADPDLLVIGVVGGAAIELALLLLHARRLDLLILPRWHGLEPATRKVIGQYLPTMLGALGSSTAVLIAPGMAAMLDPGSVAALSYGTKLVALFLAFSAQPLSTALLPYLAELAAARDARHLRHSFLGWLGLVVLFGTPAAGVFYLFSEPIIRLLFERGAFTAADTAIVAQVQALYALQIPFYLAGVMGARVLNAMSLNHITAVVGIMNCLTNILFNYLLMQWLGLPGIGLATACVYLCSCIVILAMVHLELARMERGVPIISGGIT
mgnify:CR=1 FL=1